MEIFVASLPIIVAASCLFSLLRNDVLEQYAGVQVAAKVQEAS
jgi:hypothetical protein